MLTLQFRAKSTVCPNEVTECPETTTCCPLRNGQYGCCDGVSVSLPSVGPLNMANQCQTDAGSLKMKLDYLKLVFCQKRYIISGLFEVIKASKKNWFSMFKLWSWLIVMMTGSLPFLYVCVCTFRNINVVYNLWAERKVTRGIRGCLIENTYLEDIIIENKQIKI